jgi:hypothetical protein
MVAWCAVRPVLLVVAALAAGSAHAGGRPYAFVQGVDTLAPDQLELESWFGAQVARDGGGTTWEWWLGPVVGLTDRLEAALFAIFDQPPAGALELSSLRLQLSYALADKGSWPVDVRLRAEYGQPTLSAGPHTAWFLAIASRDLDALNITANAGAWIAFDMPVGLGTETRLFLDYGLAASIVVVRGLRAGAELFGDFRTGSPGHDHFAGPALAYGQGRFWLTGAVGFGLTDTSDSRYGRVVLGIAF